MIMKMTTTITTKFIQDTLALKKKMEGYYLELGMRLKKIRDEQLYLGQYDSFAEFLFDMDMSEGSASKIIKVYSFYSEKHEISKEKLAQVGWSKLYTLMKMTDDTTSKKEVISLVEKGASLFRGDVEEEVREFEHKDCSHNWYEIHLRACKNCGKREQIYDKNN